MLGGGGRVGLNISAGPGLTDGGSLMLACDTNKRQRNINSKICLVDSRTRSIVMMPAVKKRGDMVWVSEAFTVA